MNTKQLQLVTFEQAVRLKKLGFDWETTESYDAFLQTLQPLNPFPRNFNDKVYTVNGHALASAPTVALALEWVRENWLLADWLDFSGEYDEDGEPRFYSNYLFGKEPRKTSKKAMPRKSIESALLDELLNVLEKEEKQ
ncbi:MAG: hypothetical protein LBU42_03115 [Prevotellaceae bacterium]|jgi:hypothetical protein|nr:hypothetical protein [Prevotellaceae bacterium]